MSITKRELEDLNETLQFQVRQLTTEKTRLERSLTSTTEQYRRLTEQLTKLEQRYTRLKTLLTGSWSNNEIETTTEGDERWSA